MIDVTGGTGRRPFSSLGDQQLLEQTRRLAANQRGLEVHILDHLDEIDRRGLALRRGFSSLFDYAVRELRFTDAAAQRRIQTMRLCRRHGWVRAMLHSGELSVTSAAQLETAFGAAERQCRRASAPVDEERCQGLHGLPAAPSAAGAQDAEASGAGMAGAAAMTASPRPGVAAVDQEAGALGDAGGREDPYNGNDGCGRPPDEPVAGSLGAAGGHGDRHAVSDRCRPSSDEPAAVGARPAAAGAQPVGRLDSSAATSGAAPASTAATLHAPPPAVPGRVPRPGIAGNAAAATPVVPVASHAAAQHRGARHADALPARRVSSGAAWHCPAPLHAPGPAVASSDQGPAAPIPPPASGAEPVPLPVVAPSEPRRTAALAPAPLRGDRNPELCSNPDPCASPERSAGPVSAAALLHPRRQRELIEQAAGMSTRQVAGLLASAAPQVAPPRDTLRAVAPDRYTLKVSIDQECEQGLRQLKNWLSHVDPRMSWGDLVARLVREAVARHDPRGGGGRRGRTGGAAASPRWERIRTPSIVAADAGAGEQPRAATSPNAAGVRGVAPAAPAGGARAVGTRAGGAASAPPAVAAAPEGQSAGGGPAGGAGATPIRPAAAAALMLAGGGSAGGAGATPIRPAATAALKLVGGGSADGTGATPIRPAATAAPKLAGGGSAGGAGATPIRPAATAALKLVGGGSADGTGATPIRRGTTAAPKLVRGGPADGAGATRIRPAATVAPMLAGGGSADGTGATPIRRGTTAAPKLAGGDPVDGADATRIRPAATVAPMLAGGASADGTDATPIRQGTTAAPKLAGGDPVDGADATRIRPAATVAPMLAGGASADGTDATPIRQGTTAAPKLVRGDPVDGADATRIRPATTAAPKLAGGGSADGTDAMPIRRGTTAAPMLAGGVWSARGAGGTPGGASPRCTRDVPLGPRRSPPRRSIPAAVRRHVWLRDGGRCRYRDPLTGRRCNSSHLLQIHHLLPVADGGGPEPENLALACLAHHRMCHGYGPAPPPDPSR